MPSKDKPAKPYPEFPLFPHATGRWAKKIRGKMRYFGPWENPGAALEKFNREHDDLYAGRKPRASGDGLELRQLCGQYMDSKQALLDSGDLSPVTFGNCKRVCEKVVAEFGRSTLVTDIRPEDFARLRSKLAQTNGAVSLGVLIQQVRSLFTYAARNELIPKPVFYGTAFDKPSAKTVRLARAAKGPRMLEPAELRALIDAAGQPLKAMVLLALNCGFGNSDIANLPLSAVGEGWIDYPRPKTGVERRCPLWKETITAIKATVKDRPEPQADCAGLLFVASSGGDWGRGKTDSPIGRLFASALDRQGLRRPGISFYSLRHIFATVGGETRDRDAVEFLMGHTPGNRDMSAVYRERIGDDRLLAVVNHVRGWLLWLYRKTK